MTRDSIERVMNEELSVEHGGSGMISYGRRISEAERQALWMRKGAERHVIALQVQEYLGDHRSMTRTPLLHVFLFSRDINETVSPRTAPRCT